MLNRIDINLWHVGILIQIDIGIDLDIEDIHID